MIYSIIYNLKVFSDEFAKQFGYEFEPSGYLTFFIIYLALQLLAYAVYYVFRSIYVAHKLAPDSKYVKKIEVWWILAVVFARISTLTSITKDVLYGFSNLINIINGGVPTVESLGESS